MLLMPRASPPSRGVKARSRGPAARVVRQLSHKVTRQREGHDMATWDEVARYVNANYKITGQEDGSIHLVFNTANLRSQVVFLFRGALMDGQEQWLQIESPIGKLANVNTVMALREMEDRLCGGLAVNGEFLVVRHAVPLENLDANEVDRPLVLVTATADSLEQMLTGGDTF